MMILFIALSIDDLSTGNSHQPLDIKNINMPAIKGLYDV